MRLTSWPATAALALVAGLLPTASTAVAATAPATAPAAGRPAQASTVTNYKFRLAAVSVLSSSDAWAVGSGCTVLHWNGTSWTPFTLPIKNHVCGLSAVDAVSPSDVWAVGGGTEGSTSTSTTLIVHWNGTAWTRVPSPVPPNRDVIPDLGYLSMDSATDGWATGGVEHRKSGTSSNLALHWNGTSWQRVAVDPALDLGAVTSFSPSDATSVGTKKIARFKYAPEVYQWNGTSWAATGPLPPPSGVPAYHTLVNGQSADSATDMWVAGAYYSTTVSKNLAWHWNGTSWTVMTLPTPGNSNGLSSVAAISPANVWAVGVSGAPSSAATLSMHWNGTSWTQLATPNPGQQNAYLTDVAAAGPGNVWAVGYWTSGPQGSVSHTLILHWNGSSWVQS